MTNPVNTNSSQGAILFNAQLERYNLTREKVHLIALAALASAVVIGAFSLAGILFGGPIGVAFGLIGLATAAATVIAVNNLMCRMKNSADPATPWNDNFILPQFFPFLKDLTNLAW